MFNLRGDTFEIAFPGISLVLHGELAMINFLTGLGRQDMPKEKVYSGFATPRLFLRRLALAGNPWTALPTSSWMIRSPPAESALPILAFAAACICVRFDHGAIAAEASAPATDA